MSEWARIKKSTLTGIGDAIREKEGSSDLIPTSQMKRRILDIKSGTDTSDATATSEDILLGKTAYVNDVKVVGAIEDYNGEQEGGIDTTQEDELVTRTITEYTNNRVERVGEYTFYKNSKISKVNLPKATVIGTYAFAECSALEEITLPILTTVYECAFHNCKKLKGVVDISNINEFTMLGKNVFYNCEMLENVVLPPHQINIDNYCFYNCKSLKTIDLSKVGIIYDRTFYGCSSLKSINLHNVSSLGSAAFQNCYLLENIEIGSNIISIGSNRFANCYSLKKVIIRKDSVCSLGNISAFSGCYHLNGTVNETYNPEGLKDGYIYVPDSLVDSYKSATNWSTYANQIKPLSELPQEYNTN